MGYTTYFTVSRNDGEPFTDAEAAALDALGIFDSSDDENEPSSMGGAAKWYDCSDDMKELSKLFPETVFRLHGEGGQNDDLWDAYFKHGKGQECRADIIYPDYDEEKLK